MAGRFSEVAQSGYGDILHSGVDEFQKLDFDKIYSNGYLADPELKKYRHAELLYPNTFEIDRNNCIEAVLCRNNIERTTLLNLLKDKNQKKYYKYKSIIKVCRENMFENNGLFVTDCRYHAGKVNISFSETYSKTNYTNKQKNRNSVETLSPVDARAEFDWIHTKRILHHIETEFKLDYIGTQSITFSNLPNLKEAKSIRIKLFFDDKLMCYFEQPLSEIELI